MPRSSLLSHPWLPRRPAGRFELCLQTGGWRLEAEQYIEGVVDGSWMGLTGVYLLPAEQSMGSLCVGHIQRDRGEERLCLQDQGVPGVCMGKTFVKPVQSVHSEGFSTLKKTEWWWW